MRTLGGRSVDIYMVAMDRAVGWSSGPPRLSSVELVDDPSWRTRLIRRTALNPSVSGDVFYSTCREVFDPDGSRNVVFACVLGHEGELDHAVTEQRRSLVCRYLKLLHGKSK